MTCTALDARSVEACEELLRRAAAAGVRFLPLRYESVSVAGRPADWPGPLVFLGDSIPGRRPAQRGGDLKRLAQTLLLRRLRGKKSIRVLHVPAGPGSADAVARAARFLLALGCSAADLLYRP